MRSQLAVMLAAAILAGLLAVVAIADHSHTRHRLRRAQVFAWYCEHRQRFCDREKSNPIHERWETREYAYDATMGVLAIAFVGGGVWLLRSRWAR